MAGAIPLRLSRLHFPITTLGVGRRVGLWFQGCSIHCPGCVSVDTWRADRGGTTVDEVLRAVAPWLPEADGVTISGGEPFDQPSALEGFLRELRARLPAGRDVLVYSGYAWERIEATVRAWPDLIDVLISEPFVAEAGRTLIWRGSDNQRMHLLTELGDERYRAWQHVRRADLPPRFDVAMLGDEVWLAGIPEPGALAALQAQLAEAGFLAKSSQAGERPAIPLFT